MRGYGRCIWMGIFVNSSVNVLPLRTFTTTAAVVGDTEVMK